MCSTPWTLRSWLTTRPGVGGGCSVETAQLKPPPPLRVLQAPSLPVCPRRSMGLWGAHGAPHGQNTHSLPHGQKGLPPRRGLLSALLLGRAVGKHEWSQPHPCTLRPAARALGLLPGGDTCQHSPSSATIPVPMVPAVSQLQQPATASDSRGSEPETPSNHQGDSRQNTRPAPRASGASRGSTAGRRSHTDAGSTQAPGTASGRDRHQATPALTEGQSPAAQAQAAINTCPPSTLPAPGYRLL